MKLHHLISYGLMTAGTITAARVLPQRRAWERANCTVAMMLDWDDVQAVATRSLPGQPNAQDVAHQDVAHLLGRFADSGATHLSLPELSLNRLFAQGQLSITQGHNPNRVYLQAHSAALADTVTTELQARLPQCDPRHDQDYIISFMGNLPIVAEMGLGFDPAHAELARTAGLSPVARPIGYSWVQPEMIERSLTQAAGLDVKIVAFQGNLIPGHEFKIQHTVDAMCQHGLTYAYFRQSRHQKGDWFLAKHLAAAGLVTLAHEFQPQELLDEDWHTAAYRWGNLVSEVGIRFCSIRFFRVLHAADPLESLAYVKTLAQTLRQHGMLPMPATPPNLTALQPAQDSLALAGVGLSTAGAAGLAADLLPLPDSIKLLGLAAGAVALAGLPFADRLSAGQSHHQHDHTHDHHHHDSDPDHDHHHHHGDDDDHGHSHGPAPAATTYAQKGLALAATMAYPSAALAINGLDPAIALAQSVAVTLAGATALAATTVDTDYLLGIEEYRGYNLDWLVPLGLAAASVWLQPPPPDATPGRFRHYIGRRLGFTTPARTQPSFWRWLPLAAVGLAALRSITGQLPPDYLLTLDQEHRHSHTHHLSTFQQQVGDAKMALSPRPLRKLSLLAPMGVMSAALFRQRNQPALATFSLTAAAVGHVAALAGFRHGQRSLDKTVQGRRKSWAVGVVLAGVVWGIYQLVRR